LNSGPQACKAGALPLETLPALIKTFYKMNAELLIDSVRKHPSVFIQRESGFEGQRKHISQQTLFCFTKNRLFFSTSFIKAVISLCLPY
jgi:hypothetical protein